MELTHEQKSKAYTFLADSFERKVRESNEGAFYRSVQYMATRNLILCDIEKLLTTNDILLEYFALAMFNLEGTEDGSFGYLRATLDYIASDLKEFKSGQRSDDELRAEIYRLVEENSRLQNKLDSIIDIVKK